MGVLTEHRQRFGAEPDGVWAAPGRVNLIGDHTDYNDGLVLPFAIEASAVVALGRRTDGRVAAWSAQLGDGGEVDLDDLPGRRPPGWLRYVAGIVWALRQRGIDVDGVSVVVDSAVPAGAGLASSAALECAVALGVAELAGSSVDRLDLARAAQQAEHDIVGAPVGLMDPAVSLLGARGHALLLDCRSLAHELVPLPLAGHALLVIDTGVRHAHATGGYAERRRECAAAADALGVASLRDATPDDLARVDDELLRRRARHVVTENARVQRVARLLRAGDVAGVGGVLLESHASLRDDFAVSVPELDVAVAAAVDGGAVGARLTGGGFGGCVVALAPAPTADAVRESVIAAFAAHGFAVPTVVEVQPSDGARRVECSEP